MSLLAGTLLLSRASTAAIETHLFNDAMWSAAVWFSFAVLLAL